MNPYFTDDSVIVGRMEEGVEEIPLMSTQNPTIEKLTEEICKMEFEMKRKSKEIKVIKSEKVPRAKETFPKTENSRRRKEERREPQRRESSRRHRTPTHKSPRNPPETGLSEKIIYILT